jgi:hypothetical protein
MQHRQLKEAVTTNFAPNNVKENKQSPALRGAVEAGNDDVSNEKLIITGTCLETFGCTCDGGELFYYSLFGDSLHNTPLVMIPLITFITCLLDLSPRPQEPARCQSVLETVNVPEVSIINLL